MPVVQRLVRDRRGSVAMLFGLSLLVLSLLVLGLCAGLAIDTARIYSISRKVQFALDSAALDGAKLLSVSNMPDDVLQQKTYSIFTANLRSLDANEAQLSGFRWFAQVIAQLNSLRLTR